MKNEKFRVLMFGGHFVDTNKITGEGAYITNNPHLYDADHTKEKIVETHKTVADFAGFTEAHFKNLENNLKDCRMVDVELVILETKP